MVAIIAAPLNRQSTPLRGQAMTPSIIERLDTALVEDSADGLFRCDRAIFTDAGFFELEMKHLFGETGCISRTKVKFRTRTIISQPGSDDSLSLSPEARTTSSTRSSMPAVIVARCFAVTSAATSRHSPA